LTKLNYFAAVADLERSQIFYDALLGPGERTQHRLRYLIHGLELHFYQLSPEQHRDFHLAAPPPQPSQGFSLLYDGPMPPGSRIILDWSHAPWGGWMAHIEDPDGYRWELRRASASSTDTCQTS